MNSPVLSPDDIKKKAGTYAADLVEQGMVFGLGTGSTVYWLIMELASRVEQGLEVQVVPTSVQTEELAIQSGIGIADLNTVSRLPLTIDGADEIDTNGQLIKGGGGALLREKIVAAASDRLVIIADQGKKVKTLGRFPLPVEVIPFGYTQVQQTILAGGQAQQVVLRQKNGQPFVTDQWHYILDCYYDQIADPAALNSLLHTIPGVVETGLFAGMASEAIIGKEDGTIELITYE